MVLSVFELICAGMNASMKLGTLSTRGRWRESVCLSVCRCGHAGGAALTS